MGNTKEKLTCQTVLELIPLYCLEDDNLTAAKIQAIEEHLQQCPACADDLVQTKYLQHVLTTNRDYFLEAINWSDTSEPSRSLDTFQISAKISAIAAVVMITLGIGWAFWVNRGTHEVAQQNNSQSRIDGPELTITEHGMAVSSTELTARAHVRKFLINGKHRLVLNRDTSISIDRLAKNGKLGCLVKLQGGQILAHVEHDGHLFEVQTAHGKAVITGTIFDVKATDDETALVVSEGSVSFESQKGKVMVAQGQRSTLRSQSAPTAPVACNAESLMAWASEGKDLPQVADSHAERKLDTLLADMTLPSTYPGQPIDLESLDYDQWVEEKRDWFKGQFPWISELQKALATSHQSLATEAIPDYPELLLQTGDLWQIVYPHRFYRQVPVIQKDRLAQIVDTYQLDIAEIDRIVSHTKSPYLATSKMSFGQDALNQWLALTREVERDCGNLDRLNELCEYSRVISEYLENTRTLVWLCMQRDAKVALEQKAEALNSLKQQVNLAYRCRKSAWQLRQAEADDRTATEEYARNLIRDIEIIGNNEKQHTDYQN